LPLFLEAEFCRGAYAPSRVLTGAPPVSLARRSGRRGADHGTRGRVRSPKIKMGARSVGVKLAGRWREVGQKSGSPVADGGSPLRPGFMELTYAEICVSGPVRPNNEDRVGFWQPESANDRRDFGAIALMADGVGGRSRGEVASALAVQCGLDIFCTADPTIDARKVLRQVFDLASRTIYDESLKNPVEGPMCTTLTACIFRFNEVTIGYAGDTRAYLIRRGKIDRLTTDHTPLSFQVKMGLIKEHDAMTSPSRSVLTRSVGSEPVTNFDVVTREVFKGDYIVLCTDGLYGFATDVEILDLVTHHEPGEAVQRLLQLVEKRNGEDNISAQIFRIEQVDRAIFFRGVRTGYQKTSVQEDGEEMATGSVLDNRFEIIERISRSGMACIYKARDRKSEQTVAIKVPFRHMEGDVAAATRFEREEQIGKSLNHPSVLKIIPIEERKSRPYIVMELLTGQTLAEVLKETKPLPEADAVAIASRICDALDYLHKQKVVHRDLKPQNIMLCNDGSIRVMDFGISKSAQARRMTFVGFTPAMGTPDYMAPEQVQGKRGDERTDIYSLGAILYEMVTGATLFEGENPYVVMNSRLTGDPPAPRKLNPKLTPVLEEIILHALERNPAKRYHSAAEMKAELDDYEKVQMTERWKNLQPPQIWKTKFLGPVIIGVIILNVVVLLFFILLSFVKSQAHGHH
jgi:serine/threonine protein phosphatase PrpC/tRNA A-37 threonylcarbamoyl transferase component Bud32